MIVKQFGTLDECWVRESAALTVLPPDAPSPSLLAQASEPPLVVLSDLGPGRCVADELLGTDQNAANDAVLDWAKAVAELHRKTLGLRERFVCALAKAPIELVPPDAMPTRLDAAVDSLATQCAALDVAIPNGAAESLLGLADRLGGEQYAALSPGDTCPDNNVRTDSGLTLIDFEGAQFRHVAWDVAYLRVPWPTCWCAWRLPDELALRAVERYREEIAGELAYVATDAFLRDVEAASVAWALMSALMFLPLALAGDPAPSDPRAVAPTRRAMITHRLTGASTCSEVPELAELARRLVDVLTARWGPTPLAYAPAFARQ